MKRVFVIAAAIATAALAGTTWAASADSASNYPSKPIRLIVLENPGSATDIISRILALKLGDALSQHIVTDNRFGTIGVDTAAKATPDGYTLVNGSSSTLALAPHIYKKLPYDLFNDFMPISRSVITPTLLVVHPTVPATGVKEFIALMKAKPNQLNMAFAGIGTASHLAGVLFTSMAGVRAVNSPYKGGGLSVMAVVNNEAKWTFTPLAGPLPHVRRGTLRAIAIGGVNRSSILPDVPTVSEAGLPGYNSGSWSGILVPKGTSKPIIEKLNATIVKALNSPEVKEQVLQQGSEPASSTAAEFARFIREEYERLGKVAKIAGIAAEK